MHHRGIEIDKNKVRETTEAPPLKKQKGTAEMDRPDSFLAPISLKSRRKTSTIVSLQETKGLRRVRVGGLGRGRSMK